MLFILLFPSIALALLCFIFAPAILHAILVILIFPFVAIAELFKPKPIEPTVIKPVVLTDEERLEAILSKAASAKATKAKFAAYAKRPRKKVVSPFANKD